jgi:hypothetical protein
LNPKTPATNDMSEDVKALRDIAERKQKDQQVAGIVTLLLFALVIGWCAYANNAVETDKKWCREASAKEFVDQFETRCARYRSDPGIQARIERIMAGQEK